MAEQKKLKVTLVRSTIGRRQADKSCVIGLGLRRMHQTVEVEDNPCVRGMINQAGFMLRVEEA